MFDLFRDAQMFDLRVVEHFLNRVDRRVGDAVGVEPRQPVVASLLGEGRAQHFNNLVMAIAALLACLEARVADALAEFAGFEQTFPSFVVTRQMDHERFFLTIEQAVNSSLGEIFSRHRFAAV